MGTWKLWRRGLIGGAAGAAAAGLAGGGSAPPQALAQYAAPPTAAPAARKGLECIVLGTKGGPRVGPGRSNPGYVFLVDGVPYVVDCGPRVTGQLAAAGVRLQDIRKIFITHHHNDHNIEYGNVVNLAWTNGLDRPIESYGPPPLKRMTELFWELNERDIAIRMADEGRPDPRAFLKPTELERPGVVYEDDKVRVTAALVNHPPIEPAFAFRFDAAGRSIVFSGDTTADDRLIALARGADVLLHEVIYVPGIDAIVASLPNAATLREHLIASHTPTYDVGRVAKEARVKKLVLTHLVPGDNPRIPDEAWTDEPRRAFDGEVVLGQDLMRL
jgi:ribonuclease BN (tRNA processing enzyme)